MTTLLAVVCVLLDAGYAKADSLEQLQQHLRGDMRKLVFSDRLVESGLQTAFERADGSELDLRSFAGSYVLLNFWATWCAPCREEMPALDLLEREFASERFRVVAVASGRNPLEDIQAFYHENEVTSLEVFRSPDSKLARNFAVLGLPMTIILDPEGQEIARMIGAADWYSDAARNLIGDLTNIESRAR